MRKDRINFGCHYQAGLEHEEPLSKKDDYWQKYSLRSFETLNTRAYGFMELEAVTGDHQHQDITELLRMIMGDRSEPDNEDDYEGGNGSEEEKK